MAILCIWWIWSGIILKEYLENDKIIDNKVYSKLLVRVGVAVEARRPNEFWREKIIFHQGNARSHIFVFID